MADTLADVQATFLLLESQINLLLAAVSTQAQRDALTSQYEAAARNYQATLTAAFAEDDARVAALDDQLKAANSEVSRATDNLVDINGVIHHIATAVTLGTQLVAMAGPGPGH